MGNEIVHRMRHGEIINIEDFIDETGVMNTFKVCIIKFYENDKFENIERLMCRIFTEEELVERVL